MNEVFEKILDMLEDTKDIEHDDSVAEVVSTRIWNKAIHRTKQIVNEVAEEYKDGWIPCSEKLPELRQDVLVTVKYTGFMGMHGYWIKTGHMEAENDWWGDCAGGEVIAWQPLPEPYKERD